MNPAVWLTLFLLVPTPGFEKTDIKRINDSADIWRSARHAGINSLICFLKIHGHELPASGFMESENGDGLPQNVAEIVAVANSKGYTLAARSISPEDLKTLPLPAIVHMDGDDTSSGFLNVLLQVDAQRVIYMDGATAIISTQNREAFLRAWSGVVIVEFPPGQSGSMVNLVTAGCLLLGFLVALLVFTKGAKP